MLERPPKIGQREPPFLPRAVRPNGISYDAYMTDVQIAGDADGKVELSCGTANALLSVSEPEKCEYLFRATTPALCYPIAAAPAEAETGASAAVGGASKDEL